MQDLPQELVSAIISLLQEQCWSYCEPKIPLAPLACINHNWKAAVERELWNHITIITRPDTASEDFRLFQQYLDGPERQSRRSMIRVLSIGCFYRGYIEKNRTTGAEDPCEGDNRADAEASVHAVENLCGIPEPISCEDEDDLETDAEGQLEPDSDKANALISDDGSDDEPEEDQSGHRSESDTDNIDDTDDDEEEPGSTSSEEDGSDMDSESDVDEREERTWDSVNAMISSDESDDEEPQESEEVRDQLLQQLQCKQTSVFAFITDLWAYLAGWEDSLNIKRINLQLVGNTFDSTIYAGLRHDEERIVRFLQGTLDLGLNLPNLPQVQEVFVDGRRALAFWPALIAAKIATASDAPVPSIEYRAHPFEKWWKAEAVTGLELQVTRLRNDSLTKFIAIPCRTVMR